MSVMFYNTANIKQLKQNTNIFSFNFILGMEKQRLITDFELFIKNNNLKKKDIAGYLGVSNAFITQLARGERNIPGDKLALIKANEQWDSSMLKEVVGTMKIIEIDSNVVSISVDAWEVIKNQAESLNSKDKQIDTALSQTSEVIKMLREELDKKRDAEGVKDVAKKVVHG